jgi:putative DNA methylase
MNKVRKKLIEVSIPLEAINVASAREKSIRHGHPSTLHLWWARRPLAACRAVLFAQLVDDPSAWPDKFTTEEAQDAERKRLHEIIRQMVEWPESKPLDQARFAAAIEAARWEIARSAAWGLGEAPPPQGDGEAIFDYLQTKAPPVYDPFCGGGSIPLEAQRLGLRAYGSDLNPVAVLISKALVEIPPKFAGKPPVNPKAQSELKRGRWNGKGAQGLAEDVRHYGHWMRDEAEKRIGQLYPKAKLPDGSQATVIAWLWARTVRSPDPAAKGAMVPLVSSFMLSTKEGKKAWVQPIIDATSLDGWRFEVKKRLGSSSDCGVASYISTRRQRLPSLYACQVHVCQAKYWTVSPRSVPASNPSAPSRIRQPGRNLLGVTAVLDLPSQCSPVIALRRSLPDVRMKGRWGSAGRPRNPEPGCN